MIKKKLDLNNLLAKYEGMGNMGNATTTGYYSPVRQYDRQEDQPQRDYYQSRTYQNDGATTATQTFTGNFQMSKSQCEQFLLRVREQLRVEQRNLSHFAQNSIKHIHERFHANHEKIKRQILELLDKAFAQNQRYITQELKRHQSNDPVEFHNVHKRIANIDQDINRLLYGLKGHQYRKSIAEVVMKDFTVQILELKELSKSAKDQYLQSMGEVEPDRARIECIREDLHRLFKISKKNANLVQQSLFAALGGRQTQQPMIMNSASGIDPKPKQRQRKSFFNFGFQ